MAPPYELKRGSSQAMEMLTIGEAAKRAGVQPSALRFYERRKVIPAPARVNGRRLYSEAHLRVIEMARYAQGLGFTLEEVRQLFGPAAAEGAAWRPLAEAKLGQLEETIRRARQMKKAIEAGLACGCLRAGDCPTK
jgi:MerR family redox-sensitive transcriptional activator SoxR